MTPEIIEEILSSGTSNDNIAKRLALISLIAESFSKSAAPLQNFKLNWTSDKPILDISFQTEAATTSFQSSRMLGKITSDANGNETFAFASTKDTSALENTSNEPNSLE